MNIKISGLLKSKKSVWRYIQNTGTGTEVPEYRKTRLRVLIADDTAIKRMKARIKTLDLTFWLGCYECAKASKI